MRRGRSAKAGFGGTGEPLLHKSYAKFLRMAKEKGFFASTTSNCTKLTKELADEILDLDIDRFNISLYSASPEEHIAYTKNDCYEKVVSQVRYFLEEWHRRGKRTEVNMWFLELPETNSHERFLEVWKPLADKIVRKLPKRRPSNWACNTFLPGG